jgi:FkbM family methyltransferase
MYKSILRTIGTASWLRLGIRRRAVGWFFSADKSPSYEFDVPYHGSQYKGNINVSQEWHVYFFGGYELKEVALMQAVLLALDKPVVMDVGANLGGHSLAMAPHAREIHAFEPFQPLADHVKALAARNSRTNIVVHDFGLGNETSEKEYYLDTASANSGTGSFIADHAGAPRAAKLRVVRGDEWAGERMIDFVKIDVEGFEGFVLAGLRETLTRSEPVILMEVTETSMRTIEGLRGLATLVPFPYELYEVCNPAYHLGLFQSKAFRLSRLENIVPRRASFNVLIVPDSKAHAVRHLV